MSSERVLPRAVAETIPQTRLYFETPAERVSMNQIIYIVGLVVVVIAILSFFGLR